MLDSVISLFIWNIICIYMYICVYMHTYNINAFMTQMQFSHIPFLPPNSVMYYSLLSFKYMATFFH